ncbi:MAG: hypothetical protein KatS3mg031_1584 [Chitinophagales bacterium]|nr:MAG: hypothetical protein KatS3mg031_1584 [Chitinophagales bacterium]
MKTRHFNLLLICLIGCLSACKWFHTDKILVGDRAPDLYVPSASGDTLSLSAYRGNLVLLHFWASWCAPCRRENPKLVELYSKYRDVPFKNAERLVFFSVSLDSDRNKWLKAIEDDHLYWDAHGCDLQGWKSPAADSFQVVSIPASFLINHKGIVIGKDLSPRDLDKLLASLSEAR